jgi:hypothetical protein
MMLRYIDDSMEMNRTVFVCAATPSRCCGIALLTLVPQCRSEETAP